MVVAIYASTGNRLDLGLVLGIGASWYLGMVGHIRSRRALGLDGVLPGDHFQAVATRWPLELYGDPLGRLSDRMLVLGHG